MFLTTGGMGPECERLNKRLAELISNKSSERYSHVMSYVRTRLRFVLLKATVIAIRGVRGKSASSGHNDELEVDQPDFFQLDPKRINQLKLHKKYQKHNTYH